MAEQLKDDESSARDCDKSWSLMKNEEVGILFS